MYKIAYNHKDTINNFYTFILIIFVVLIQAFTNINDIN
jgi:hypothetical protein